MVSTGKIGVLYPQSKQFNNLATDFVKGLKLSGLSVQFVFESIGVGADEKLILDKIQKLQLQEDIVVFIAFLGHNRVEDIYEYVESNNLILIESNLGALLPDFTKKYKGVYINSYGLAESVYHLGKYIGNANLQTICSSSSYYDTGYGMLLALDYGINGSNTQFVGHYITPFYPRENEGVLMKQTIEATNADCVVAFFSGLFAEEHADFVKETNLLTNYPYYVTPFTINQKFVANNNTDNVKIVSSWMAPTTDSCAFTEAYQTKHKTVPSVFALLGYESALILNELVLTNVTNYNETLNCLDAMNIAGPRGIIQSDLNTNRIFYNHYIFKITAHDQNTCIYEKELKLTTNEKFIDQIRTIPVPDKIGGWYNAYLCH